MIGGTVPKLINSRTGFVWYYHVGYARGTCKHRTEYAMRRCADRSQAKRDRDRAGEARPMG